MIFLKIGTFHLQKGGGSNEICIYILLCSQNALQVPIPNMLFILFFKWGTKMPCKKHGHVFHFSAHNSFTPFDCKSFIQSILNIFIPYVLPKNPPFSPTYLGQRRAPHRPI
jgi:hypothetical protein